MYKTKAELSALKQAMIAWILATNVSDAQAATKAIDTELIANMDEIVGEINACLLDDTREIIRLNAMLYQIPANLIAPDLGPDQVLDYIWNACRLATTPH